MMNLTFLNNQHFLAIMRGNASSKNWMQNDLDVTLYEIPGNQSGCLTLQYITHIQMINTFVVFSYHIYKLGELEFDLDSDGVGDVLDGSDQLVVARQDLIIESLGIWVAQTSLWNNKNINHHSAKIGNCSN